MNSQLPNYTLLDADRTKEMLKLFKGVRAGWVQVGEKKWFFPYTYTKEVEAFYNFKPRPSDTWIISYPRSGTTVMQELIWLLSNNLDFETVRKTKLTERFPFLERSLVNNPEVIEEFVTMDEGNVEKREVCETLTRPAYEVLEGLSTPRFIQSHFPLSLRPSILDSGCKIIYIARNPKDVVVSWYKMNKFTVTHGYIGDFSTFWNLFKNDLTIWSPYCEHVKEAWARRNHPNFLFIFYEELSVDLLSVCKKVANFLGKNYSENQLTELLNHLSIEKFRKNPMVNLNDLYECGIFSSRQFFIGKGKTGHWKEFFSADMEKEADEWIEQNLKDTDLVFPTTIMKGNCY
ncbi:sulfotransferase 4A1-like [Belonocnema kinseyi]|uniref:sulfotransferase 4A1-like n=1 Tax=Belonocnema kinseyi TaxID=2817044 RepID=UPI00143D2B94|nr:sulfotransferase 4A1-like [Belonocnema kinseyi]XP_033231020.1 sulfotransferase 4A1-like [Belonocnema kinseyi]XP_033231021.1 sulfotransferase 4A1-like [Belonocnema kinseyi]